MEAAEVKVNEEVCSIGTSQPLRKRLNLSREAANFVFPGQDLAVWIRHSLILQNL